MPQPPKASVVIPGFSDDDFNDSLAALFSSDLDPDEPAQLEQISAAFINLVFAFIHIRKWTFLMEAVRFDTAGIELMIRRFHRDAFGVHKFKKYVKELEATGKIQAADGNEILRRVTNLGLRISSDKPRKTKIAAAFSLWLSTFRPVFFQELAKTGVPTKNISHFCSSLNVWLVATFFDRFGEFVLDGEGAEIRLDRLKHDLTCRALSMSSLEMMYAGLFRGDPPVEEEKT